MPWLPPTLVRPRLEMKREPIDSTRCALGKVFHLVRAKLKGNILGFGGLGAGPGRPENPAPNVFLVVKICRVWSEAGSFCFGLRPCQQDCLCHGGGCCAERKKGKVMQVIAPKVVQDNVRMKVEDVSFGTGIGWRDVDPKRTAELKKMFIDGLFGVNILKRPMILGKHEKIATAPDGNAAILDGTHTFTALAELPVLYKVAMAAATDPATA